MDEQTGKHFLFNGIETKWATDEEETFFQRQIIAAIDDHKHIEHILDEDSVENSSKRNTQIIEEDDIPKIEYDISDVLHEIGLDIEKDHELHWIGSECKDVLESSTLPDPWTEVVYEKEGTTYYHNQVTDETTWDHPALQIYIDKVFAEKQKLDENYAKAIYFCKTFSYKKIWIRLKKILKQRQKINKYASHYSSTSLMMKFLRHWRSYVHKRKTTKYKYKMFYFRTTVSKVFLAWQQIAKQLGDQNPESRIARKFARITISRKIFNGWKKRTKIMSKIRNKKKKKENLAIQLYNRNLKRKIYELLCDGILRQKGNRQYLILKLHEKNIFPNSFISMYDLNTLLYINKRWYDMALTYLHALSTCKVVQIFSPQKLELNIITHCKNLHTLNLKRNGDSINDLDILNIAKECLFIENLDVSYCNIIGDKNFKNAISNYWNDTLHTVSLRGCPVDKFDTIDILLNKLPNIIRLDVGPHIEKKTIVFGQKISKYKNLSRFFLRYTLLASKRQNMKSDGLKVLKIAGVKTNILEIIKVLKMFKRSLRMLDISWTRIFHDINQVVDLLICVPLLKYLECYGAMKHDQNGSVMAATKIQWIDVEQLMTKRLKHSILHTEINVNTTSHGFLPPVNNTNKINCNINSMKHDICTKLNTNNTKVKRSILKIYERQKNVYKMFCTN
eukprot:g10725.t1